MKQHKYLGVVLALALLTTACPTSSQLDTMAKASNELAHDTLLANKVVAEFFKAGKIPLAEKIRSLLSLESLETRAKHLILS
jgi:hypothetical protein